MSTDNDDDRARSWSTWFKPNDQPNRTREAELHDLHQQAQREAKEHIEASKHDMDDPFIAFKHFIDRSISAISALPHKMAANMREAHELREKQEVMDKDFYGRWTGRPGREREDRMALFQEDTTEDAENVALILLHESKKRNAHVPHHKIAALYHDPRTGEDLAKEGSDGPFLSHGGACYYKSEDRDSLTRSGNGAWRSSEPRWLSVDWFKRSRYSPISLEADPRLGQYDTKWRHAFEDLLEAALDKPMTSQERFGYRPLVGGAVGNLQSTRRACGLDWMLSLQCRGILPPQLPSIYAPVFGIDMPAVDNDITALVRELRTPPSELSAAVPGLSAAKPTCDVEDAVASLSRPHWTELDAYEEYECLVRGPSADAIGAGIRERHASEQATVARKGRCPDDLGHAIGQSAREESGCPDELDRAVGQAARDKGMTELLDLLGLSPSVKPDAVASGNFDDDTVNDDDDDEGDPVDLETALESLHECQQQLGLLEAGNKRRFESLRGEDENRTRSRVVEEDEHVFEDEEDEDDHEDGEDLPGELWSQARINRERHVAELQQLSERNLKRAAHPQHLKQEQDLAASQQPRVLSALTTTQTTRSADGTVTTKVVLKRRFADGSEETHEQSHMFNENDEGLPQRQPAKQVEDEKKKSKGWFWS